MRLSMIATKRKNQRGLAIKKQATDTGGHGESPIKRKQTLVDNQLTISPKRQRNTVEPANFNNVAFTTENLIPPSTRSDISDESRNASHAALSQE